MFAGCMTNYFTTILPPNAPSCRNTNLAGMVVSSTTDINVPGIETPSSYHSGGVQCGLLDGSVRFISETVDTGTAATRTTAADETGPSPFGVWGALGTANGSESVSF
jgi:hypothetical protein